MGRRRKQRGRPINGILILDKPTGITSNFALQKAKRIFDVAKAGHTGSLDPLATGVLPLCFGEATKFSQYLLDSDKRYVVKAKLGVVTDTGDSDGSVIEEKPVPVLDEAVLLQTVKSFEGEIEQIPPMYSALKYKGQPLYKLAREGIEVERKPRKVTLFSVELLSFDDTVFQLDVRCSKGTYIRTLIEDIGKIVGCGAHVTELLRTEAGPYDLEQAITFEQLEALLVDEDLVDEMNKLSDQENKQKIDGLLLPMWSAVSDWPEVQLTEKSAYYLQQGQMVETPKVEGKQALPQGWVRLSQGGEHFLGVGEILDDGRIAPRRLVNQETQ